MASEEQEDVLPPPPPPELPKRGIDFGCLLRSLGDAHEVVCLEVVGLRAQIADLEDELKMRGGGKPFGSDRASCATGCLTGRDNHLEINTGLAINPGGRGPSYQPRIILEERSEKFTVPEFPETKSWLPIPQEQIATRFFDPRVLEASPCLPEVPENAASALFLKDPRVVASTPDEDVLLSPKGLGDRVPNAERRGFSPRFPNPKEPTEMPMSRVAAALASPRQFLPWTLSASPRTPDPEAAARAEAAQARPPLSSGRSGRSGNEPRPLQQSSGRSTTDDEEESSTQQVDVRESPTAGTADVLERRTSADTREDDMPFFQSHEIGEIDEAIIASAALGIRSSTGARAKSQSGLLSSQQIGLHLAAEKKDRKTILQQLLCRHQTTDEGKSRTPLELLEQYNRLLMVEDDGAGKCLRKSCRGKRLMKLSFMERLVDSPLFDFIVGLFVIVNVLQIIVESDFSVRANIDAATSSEPFTIPEAPEVFKVMDFSFLFFFLAEIAVRLLATEGDYFAGENKYWNFMDCLLASFAGVELFVSSQVLDATSLRTLRVFKMMRALRIIRVLKVFRELRLLVDAILNVVGPLCWTGVLLVVFLGMFSVFFCGVVTAEVQDNPDNDEFTGWAKTYFGSVPIAGLSLFMSLTNGESWRYIAKGLWDAGAFYGFIFVLWQVFMGFGVLNIVTSIFVASAHRFTEMDMEFIQTTELDRQAQLLNRLQTFFDIFDQDKSGDLSMEEFEGLVQDPSVKAFFEKILHIQTWKMRRFFSLLDADEDGRLERHEFIAGCMNLAGGSQNIDMETVRSVCCLTKKSVNRIAEKVDAIEVQVCALHGKNKKKRGGKADNAQDVAAIKDKDHKDHVKDDKDSAKDHVKNDKDSAKDRAKDDNHVKNDKDPAKDAKEATDPKDEKD